MRKLAILCCLVLLIAVIAIPASADERNKKTTITFNAPVAVPGMVLPAGTYVFRLLESATNRNIVVVYNAEETHAYTMILAIPNYRLRPVDEPVLRFKEGLRGAPDALHAWFFSGDQWGQEFVYPKTEAALIAENTGERVLEAEITPEETPEALTETHVAVMTPQKEEEEFYSEEVAEALATPTLIETPPVERAAVTAVEEELPKTAGNLPLVALLGFSSLALAGLLNFKRKTR